MSGAWKATVRDGSALRELTFTADASGTVWSHNADGQCYGPTGAEAIDRFARLCNWKVLEIVPPDGVTYDTSRVPTPAVHELLTGVTDGDWQWHSFGKDAGVYSFSREDMGYELLATTKHRKNAMLMGAAKGLALDLIDARAERDRLRVIVSADDRVAAAQRQERERIAVMVAEARAQVGKGWTVRAALDLIATKLARDPSGGGA